MTNAMRLAASVLILLAAGGGDAGAGGGRKARPRAAAWTVTGRTTVVSDNQTLRAHRLRARQWVNLRPRLAGVVDLGHTHSRDDKQHLLVRATAMIESTALPPHLKAKVRKILVESARDRAARVMIDEGGTITVKTAAVEAQIGPKRLEIKDRTRRGDRIVLFDASNGIESQRDITDVETPSLTALREALQQAAEQE